MLITDGVTELDFKKVAELSVAMGAKTLIYSFFIFIMLPLVVVDAKADTSSSSVLSKRDAFGPQSFNDLHSAYLNRCDKCGIRGGSSNKVEVFYRVLITRLILYTKCTLETRILTRKLSMERTQKSESFLGNVTNESPLTTAMVSVLAIFCHPNGSS